MEKPIKEGKFSAKQAEEVLGRCSLGKKPSKYETKHFRSQCGCGFLERDELVPVDYEYAYISLIDNDLFVWADF